MMWDRVAKLLESNQPCVLIEIANAEGSTPREVGAQMVVTPHGFHGTIGGGALEWQALAKAQKLLNDKSRQQERFTLSLGPDLGQCCGGRVAVSLTTYQPSQLSHVQALAESSSGTTRPILLYGAGHVGRALLLALAPLPFDVTWIDTRPGAFPGAVPSNVKTIETIKPLSELASAPDGAFIVVMTHSHALDLEIVDAALRAKRFPYIGLIGSNTKRARFVSRLKSGGLPTEDMIQLVCPIGATSIRSKLPAAIAAGIAVQLLERDDMLKTAQNTVSEELASATRVSGGKA